MYYILLHINIIIWDRSGRWQTVSSVVTRHAQIGGCWHNNIIIIANSNGAAGGDDHIDFSIPKRACGVGSAVLTHTHTHINMIPIMMRVGVMCVCAVLVGKHKIEKHERWEIQRCHRHAIDSSSNCANSSSYCKVRMAACSLIITYKTYKYNNRSSGVIWSCLLGGGLKHLIPTGLPIFIMYILWY